MSRLRQRIRATDDGGYSLIELIVAISLLAIVGTIITSTVIVALRSSETVENTAASTASARTAESRVLSLLRSAVPPSSSSTTPPPAVWAASDWAIGLYSQHGLDPRSPANEVVLYVNGAGELIERVTTPSGRGPDWTYSTTNRTERVILHGLTTRSIFAYYDEVASDADPLTYSGGWLSSTDLESVVSMRVELTVDADDNARTSPVTISSWLALRNLS